jgi:hypothetical protein
MEEDEYLYIKNEDEHESELQQYTKIIESQQKTIEEQNMIISGWLMNDYLNDDKIDNNKNDDEEYETIEFDNIEDLFEKHISCELSDDYVIFFNKIERIVKTRLRNNDEKMIADRYIMSNMLRLYLQRKLKYVQAVINNCDMKKLKRPILIMKRRLNVLKHKNLICKDYVIECKKGRNSRKYNIVYKRKK